jgi:hypothetical protein
MVPSTSSDRLITLPLRDPVVCRRGAPVGWKTSSQCVNLKDYELFATAHTASVGSSSASASPAARTKHIKVVINSNVPVDVYISDDSLDWLQQEEITGTKTYEPTSPKALASRYRPQARTSGERYPSRSTRTVPSSHMTRTRRAWHRLFTRALQSERPGSNKEGDDIGPATLTYVATPREFRRT